ncbi:unnamed protein product, partial [Heterosigma akashiwo]
GGSLPPLYQLGLPMGKPLRHGKETQRLRRRHWAERGAPYLAKDPAGRRGGRALRLGVRGPGGPPAGAAGAGRAARAPARGCVPDAVNGAKFVRDLYEKANDSLGKYSVPILWDKKEQTIVNNESSEIIRMLNSEFNAFAEPALDLYPPALRAAVDAANAWVYPAVNNGVYRSGFAQTQARRGTAGGGLYSLL